MNTQKGSFFQVYNAGTGLIGLRQIGQDDTTLPEVIDELGRHETLNMREPYKGFVWYPLEGWAGGLAGIFIPKDQMDEFVLRREQWAEEVQDSYFQEFVVYFVRH